MNKINWDDITLPDLPDGWQWFTDDDLVRVESVTEPNAYMVFNIWSGLGKANVSDGTDDLVKSIPVQVCLIFSHVVDQILSNPIGPAVPEKACDDCASEPQLAQVTSVRYGVDPDSGQELSLTLEVTGLFGSSTLTAYGNHAGRRLYASGVSDVSHLKGKLCSVRVRDGLVSFCQWFKRGAE